MPLQYLTIEKVQRLEQSTGWLSNYIGSEDPDSMHHHIGPELGDVDWKRTLLLARLADLNKQRALVLDELMSPIEPDSVVPDLPQVIDWIMGAEGHADLPSSLAEACAREAFGAVKRAGLMEDSEVQMEEGQIDYMNTVCDILEKCTGEQLKRIVSHLSL